MKPLEALGFAILLAVSAKAASQSPLADAAEKSDRAAIGTLLKQRADVNAQQVDGMTALQWAAHLDDLDTARLLVAVGADPNATSHGGVALRVLAWHPGTTEPVDAVGARGEAAQRGDS